MESISNKYLIAIKEKTDCYHHIEFKDEQSIKEKIKDIYPKIQINKLEENAEKEIFFTLEISCQLQNNLIPDSFLSACKKIENIFDIDKNKLTIKKASEKQEVICDGVKIETLWNGISFFYSTESYKLIHQVENLTRAIVNYFMHTKAGRDWLIGFNEKSTDIRKLKERKSQNHLYELEFSDLGKILYEVYGYEQSINNIKHEFNKSNQHKEDSISIKLLEKILPKSYLETFFPEFEKINGKDFKGIWKRLTELRNIVAHNKFINHDTFDEIKKYANPIISYTKRSMIEIPKMSPDEHDLSNMVAHISATLNNETIEDDYSDAIEEEPININTSSQYKGVLFDTNNSYDENAVWEMMKNKYVAAYGDAKHYIEYLNTEDIIFFYHRGYGIIAAGKVTDKKTNKGNGTSYKKEVVFLTAIPKTSEIKSHVSIKKIREITGRNFFWARTLKVPYLSSDETNNLLEKIIPILGKADDTDS
ncbi:MAG: hypothetical protein L3K52_17220 [Candidatus Thiothrix sulfatifontis]|nr:MAG: hypothetical protein L3K52_17220 [Candidatus Thiothrix sulfatifontis]